MLRCANTRTARIYTKQGTYFQDELTQGQVIRRSGGLTKVGKVQRSHRRWVLLTQQLNHIRATINSYRPLDMMRINPHPDFGVPRLVPSQAPDLGTARFGSEKDKQMNQKNQKRKQKQGHGQEEEQYLVREDEDKLEEREKQRNEIVARVQVARRHFDGTASGVNQQADPHALLERAFGHSALLDDELSHALTLLRNLEMKHSNSQNADVQSDGVCFLTWVVFAVEVGIPVPDDNVIILQEPQLTLHAREGTSEANEINCWMYFDAAIGFPVQLFQSIWKSTEYKLSGYLFGLFAWIMFAMPWYWGFFAGDVSFFEGGLMEHWTHEPDHLVRSAWDLNHDELLNLTEFDVPLEVADQEYWEASLGYPQHNRTVWVRPESHEPAPKESMRAAVDQLYR